MNISTNKKGFTLVEVIIVIAVISILTAAIIPAINKAREKSRDAQRVSDLARIEFALEVYLEANGKFPDADELGADTVIIGEGGALDSLLVGFMGVVPKDPLHDISGFDYVYDVDNSCSEAVVYARTVERDVSDNTAPVCNDTVGGQSYIIALGDTKIVGGGDVDEVVNPPLPADGETFTTDGGEEVTVSKSTFGGHTYYVSDDELSPEDAIDVAEQAGAHLVTLSNNGETNYIMGIAEDMGADAVWLGLYQDEDGAEPDGGWIWDDGTTLEEGGYSNWCQQASKCGNGNLQPNDTLGGGQDCAQAVVDWGGLWNDWNCGYTGSHRLSESVLIFEFDYIE